MTTDNAGLLPYPNASTERLDIIEANECDRDGSLCTKRFEALFNEIYRLNQASTPSHVEAMRLALGALRHNKYRYGVNWRQEKAIAAAEALGYGGERCQID
jgi:hypothetical protein